MRISNEDPEYVAAAQRAVENIICPNCGQPAKYTGIGVSGGTFWMLPVFACDTDGCPFAVDGEATWTLASLS